MISWFKRALAPGTAFLGAGISCVGALYGIGALTAFGAIVAALAAVAMSIWQAEWQEKIQSQADIIAQQSRRIESLVTGGDNYAYGSFSPAGDGQSFNLVLVNAGSFPLYDIVLQIFDVTASGSASVQTSRGGLLAFRQTISIGNIAPDAALVSGVMLTMPTGGSRQDYNLFSAAGTVSGISSSAFET